MRNHTRLSTLILSLSLTAACMPPSAEPCDGARCTVVDSGSDASADAPPADVVDAAVSRPAWTANTPGFIFRNGSAPGPMPDAGVRFCAVEYSRANRTLRGPFFLQSGFSQGPQLTVNHTLTDPELAELNTILEGLRAEPYTCSGNDGPYQTLELQGVEYSIGSTTCFPWVAREVIRNGSSLAPFIARFAP